MKSYFYKIAVCYLLGYNAGLVVNSFVSEEVRFYLRDCAISWATSAPFGSCQAE